MPTPEQLDAVIKSVARRFDGFGGNCGRFAAVLNEVLEGQGEYVIVSGDHYEYVDHILLKHDGHLFDADGMTTIDEVKDKWCDDGQEIEELHDPSLHGIDVRRLVDDCSPFASHYDDEALETAIREGLAAEAGPAPSPSM